MARLPAQAKCARNQTSTLPPEPRHQQAQRFRHSTLRQDWSDTSILISVIVRSDEKAEWPRVRPLGKFESEKSLRRCHAALDVDLVNSREACVADRPPPPPPDPEPLYPELPSPPSSSFIRVALEPEPAPNPEVLRWVALRSDDSVRMFSRIFPYLLTIS